MSRPLLVVIAAAMLAPIGAHAGEWGIGIGAEHHRPVQQGAKSEVTGWPFPFYEGERFKLGFGSLSYVVADTGGFQLALEGQARFDSYKPRKSGALAGMRERDSAFDIGFSLSTNGSWGIAQLEILGDITSTHKGYEISANYLQPYQSGRWTLVRSVGLNWRSSELVDYYYGVRDNESTTGRPSFKGTSGLGVMLGFGVDFAINDRWHVAGGAKAEYLGDNIKDSPIIDTNRDLSIFSALVYRFQ